MKLLLLVLTLFVQKCKKKLTKEEIHSEKNPFNSTAALWFVSSQVISYFNQKSDYMYDFLLYTILYFVIFFCESLRWLSCKCICLVSQFFSFVLFVLIDFWKFKNDVQMNCSCASQFSASKRNPLFIQTLRKEIKSPWISWCALSCCWWIIIIIIINKKIL